ATCLRLVGGALLGAVLTLLLGHRLIGLMYPYGRTSLYLVVLVPLATVTAADLLFDRGRYFALAAMPATAALAVALVLYSAQFRTNRFTEWPFAADVKQALKVIRDRTPATSTVRVGGSSVYYYLLAYYRDLYRWTWIDPVYPYG